MKTLLLIPAIGLLLLTGCNKRNQVEVDALRSDNTRLASELDALYKENALLKQQRDKARDELVLQRAQTKGLEQQLRDSLAKGPLRDFGWVVDEKGGLSLPEDFAFERGSATLNSKGAQAVQALARQLQTADLKGTKVFVIGHTDNTPVVRSSTKKQFIDNWGLSAMRSAAVVRELQRTGIVPERLYGTFRGQYEPRADNKSKDGKAQNRRVNIQVSL